jgi:hypothetical protein
LESLVRSCGEVRRVHFDADSAGLHVEVGQNGREDVHRVAVVWRVNVVVAVGADVGLGEPRRRAGPVRVHVAADPDGLVVFAGEDDGLVDVKRPAVVPGEVVHVRRVGHDERVEVARLEPGSRPFDPPFVLRPRKDVSWHVVAPTERLSPTVPKYFVYKYHRNRVRLAGTPHRPVGRSHRPTLVETQKPACPHPVV